METSLHEISVTSPLQSRKICVCESHDMFYRCKAFVTIEISSKKPLECDVGVLQYIFIILAIIKLASSNASLFECVV